MAKIIRFPGTPTPYAEMSPLERAEAQLQILTAYLDTHDPNWRTTLKSEIESESE